MLSLLRRALTKIILYNTQVYLDNIEIPAMPRQKPTYYTSPDLENIRTSLLVRTVEKYKDASSPESYTTIILVSSNTNIGQRLDKIAGTDETVQVATLKNVQVVDATVMCGQVVIRRVDKLSPNQPLCAVAIRKIYYPNGADGDVPTHEMVTAAKEREDHISPPPTLTVNIYYEEYGPVPAEGSLQDMLVCLIAMLVPAALFTWWLVKYGCDYVLDCTASSKLPLIPLIPLDTELAPRTFEQDIFTPSNFANLMCSGFLHLLHKKGLLNDTDILLSWSTALVLENADKDQWPNLCIYETREAIVCKSHPTIALQLNGVPEADSTTPSNPYTGKTDAEVATQLLLGDHLTFTGYNAEE